MTKLTENHCSAHKAMCLYPECHEECTGRASNWNSVRFEFLSLAATSNGLHRDIAALAPEDCGWLLDQMLIFADYNRYRATGGGLKALFPTMRVL